MRDRSWLLTTLLAGLCALAALGGCGSSGTKIVTVSSAPHSTTSENTTTTTKTPPTTTQATKTVAPTSTSGGTEAPTTTRTATAPAFTHTEGATGASGSAAGAATVVREQGYTANDTSDYHPEQTLTVLIGTRTGSGDGYDQQAFFFLDGKYIGTDAKQPSASVKVVGQSDTEVTLAYPLYRSGDPLGKPSGEKIVRFQLNNGRLVALQPIPPASARNAGN
ncbi:MAG: LppP/LprE family lipoprotein [Solirubrobacteraceae bacterium]